ncbi:class I SAM-dependent methyltransferase [Nonomuraea angiospora]|uniref:class I SAM-dependent methyltransferase n=1 Tax=Nonomuraea angiospora TaxID=46172 RepID=UPI0033E2C397
MATKEIQSWAYDEPIRSPFALPQGILGRLAGRLMLWLNDPSELVTLIGKQDSVLEAGCGPGGLLRHIEAERVCGIDPSPEMLRQAARHTRGRAVELRLGTAADTDAAPRAQESDRSRKAPPRPGDAVDARPVARRR